jgi:hypothetical protein
MVTQYDSISYASTSHTRRLARSHAMPARFLHHYPTCNMDVPEYIEYFLLEWPRLDCHRRNFGTLAP